MVLIVFYTALVLHEFLSIITCLVCPAHIDIFTAVFYLIVFEQIKWWWWWLSYYYKSSFI